MNVKKSVLIMAGGTGGHIFPGLALAQELKSRGYEIQWLGTRRGLEYRLVPEAEIKLHVLSIEGVRGRGFGALIKAPFLIAKAVLQAMQTIRQIQPGLVVGLGGFVAGPGGVAAKLMGVPLVIHEQNAIAGTTNKLLAVIAKKVLTGFPNAFNKSVVIGNPVRREITDIETPASRIQKNPESINVLVLGGSRGARAINELMPEVCLRVENICRANSDLPVMKLCHQTGDALIEETMALYKEKGIAINDQQSARAPDVVPFLSNMAEKFSWANLVICRSGALTVSEIACAGVASILVPFPYAIDDHQTANAKYMVEAGAAKLWQQAELSAAILADEVIEFLKAPAKLIEMATYARSQAKPNATRDFADECEKLYAVQIA
ncbi:UDP-N-acetylglucosamine-N-acetylmuramylpentapeptide N-acetylglucosamine transferase [Alteromonadaceae bacterium 2753L.S.0a.02]|nr:UDP-N-acetylglucosamine-N-acetylmuramylpentapeptide N-acetylglucosamine transferase [Alteromonadaceae bacterium 2753L.S.0a.02]